MHVFVECYLCTPWKPHIHPSRPSSNVFLSVKPSSLASLLHIALQQHFFDSLKSQITFFMEFLSSIACLPLPLSLQRMSGMSHSLPCPSAQSLAQQVLREWLIPLTTGGLVPVSSCLSNITDGQTNHLGWVLRCKSFFGLLTLSN